MSRLPIPVPRYRRGQGWSVRRHRAVWAYPTPWGALAGWYQLNRADRHARPPAARIRLAARRGATLLDSVVPGWAARCDPVTLDVNDPSRCVLMQVFGNYRAGLDAVRPLMSETALDYGFAWYSGDPHGHAGLVIAWRTEIAARRIDQYRHLFKA